VPSVYILRCADASLYVGHTGDLKTRERTHNDGRGGTYTARRRPVRLIYSEEFATLEEARGRERQLKRWSRVKKEALIARNTSELRRLSGCRRRPRVSP
jgi:predicted GIY-YIG superfamily endonuclease